MVWVSGGSLLSVAIAATHFALGYFGHDYRHRLIVNKLRYLGILFPLLFNVVKLKDNRVRLAAINAGMLREVVDKEASALMPLCDEIMLVVVRVRFLPITQVVYGALSASDMISSGF